MTQKSELFEDRQKFLDTLFQEIPELISLEEKKGDGRSVVLSIDAPWGHGKTFFLKHLKNKFQSAGYPVLEFNAWENDFDIDPFISLYDSFLGQLNKLCQPFDWENQRNIKRARKELGKIISKTAKAITGLDVPGFVELGREIKRYFTSLFSGSRLHFETPVPSQSAEIRQKIIEIFDLYREVLETRFLNGNIIILVDELDRCRPTYSVEVLECIKHLFCIPKACFVFAVNSDALSASLKTIYGNINSLDYLNRFFDYSYFLPPPPVRDYFLVLTAPYNNSTTENMIRLMAAIIGYDDGKGVVSLRDVDHIVNRFVRSIRRFYMGDWGVIKEIWFSVFFVLQHFDKQFVDTCFAAPTLSKIKPKEDRKKWIKECIRNFRISYKSGSKRKSFPVFEALHFKDRTGLNSASQYTISFLPEYYKVFNDINPSGSAGRFFLPEDIDDAKSCSEALLDLKLEKETEQAFMDLYDGTNLG